MANAKKRARDRARRPLHLKRVSAQLKVISAAFHMPAISEARVVLNDLSGKGMGLFSSYPLLPGQEVAIMLEDPQRIYLRGRIVWCQESATESRLLAVKSFGFRIGIEFVFESPEEEQTVQAFCDQLTRDYLYNSRVA